MATYRLQCGTGDDLRQVELLPGTATRVGRSPDSDLVLLAPRVSAEHAVFENRGGRIFLRDLNSRNGTRINGSPVTEERGVEGGDVIDLGGEELLLVREQDPLDDTTISLLDDEEDGRRIYASLDVGTAFAARAEDRTEGPDRAHRNLKIIQMLGEILLDLADEDELARRVLDLVFEIVPADQACVIFREADGAVRVRAARSRRRARGILGVSRTILMRSIEEGLSLLTADASEDTRFQDGASVIVQGIHAAMCAPLRGRSAALGAIYVDSRLKKGVFSQDDLELLTVLGIQGGIALENLRLRRANLQAERLAATGGVIAGLSHDVRNILTALRGGSHLMNLVVEKTEDETLRLAWEAIRQSSDRIGQLVEDMVSYSKEREPEKEPTDINDLVGQVVARLRPRADEEGPEIAFEPDPAIEPMDADSTGIDRVLTNLLANALDAVSGEGGRVTVRTAPAAEPHRVQVEVRDNGPGIPPEDRERIFDLLYSTKGSKGTGFGLAIAKKIVHEHGGTIVVESEPGSGATFRIVL